MGQQQLLLIILGVIIVGIAIAVGLSLFSAQSVQSNRDAIINDLNNLAAQAYQFRIRPQSMGGGQGDYTTFSIPSKMATNENATYSIGTPGKDNIVFLAKSAQNGSNTITVTITSEGKLTTWTYAGDFL
jgi:type II secretory pathway pseudopilin PulG